MTASYKIPPKPQLPRVIVIAGLNEAYHVMKQLKDELDAAREDGSETSASSRRAAKKYLRLRTLGAQFVSKVTQGNSYAIKRRLKEIGCSDVDKLSWREVAGLLLSMEFDLYLDV